MRPPIVCNICTGLPFFHTSACKGMLMAPAFLPVSMYTSARWPTPQSLGTINPRHPREIHESHGPLVAPNESLCRDTPGPVWSGRRFLPVVQERARPWRTHPRSRDPHSFIEISRKMDAPGTTISPKLAVSSDDQAIKGGVIRVSPGGLAENAVSHVQLPAGAELPLWLPMPEPAPPLPQRDSGSLIHLFLRDAF